MRVVWHRSKLPKILSSLTIPKRDLKIYMNKKAIRNTGDQRLIIPGLKSESKYTARLSTRSALYSDMRLLLEGISVPLSGHAFRRLVLEENRLARSSTSARTKLWKELRGRFILDCDHPLFHSFFIEWVRCQSEPEFALTAYILFALNDRLAADLGQDWLFSNLRRAPHEIRVGDVLHFIDGKAELHPEIAGWSPETKKSVARHYMASIRDFGLAQGKVKKTTQRPALYPSPVRLLIRALRIAGVKPMALIQANIFHLLGLNGPEVIEALGELNRRGDLRFKIQADVIELDVESAQ